MTGGLQFREGVGLSSVSPKKVSVFERFDSSKEMRDLRGMFVVVINACGNSSLQKLKMGS